MTDTNDDLDLGYDLEIQKTSRRAAGAGTWVTGMLMGHCFEALVFPEHAENPAWEIGDSRISKLWIPRPCVPEVNARRSSGAVSWLGSRDSHSASLGR
jgi:hypothetical protein